MGKPIARIVPSTRRSLPGPLLRARYHLYTLSLETDDSALQAECLQMIETIDRRIDAILATRHVRKKRRYDKTLILGERDD